MVHRGPPQGTKPSGKRWRVFWKAKRMYGTAPGSRQRWGGIARGKCLQPDHLRMCSFCTRTRRSSLQEDSSCLALVRKERVHPGPLEQHWSWEPDHLSSAITTRKQLYVWKSYLTCLNLGRSPIFPDCYKVFCL